MRLSQPLTDGPKQPFRASFLDEQDGRYADVNGIIYPVLLSSSRSKRRYVEDMSDSEDYTVAWCRQFRQDLAGRAAAVLVSDSDEYSWNFLGLFQVHDIQLTNFLTCRIGAKLAKLKVLPTAT